MKLTGRALVCGVAATTLPTLPTLGCSSASEGTGSTGLGTVENVGEVALELTLPGGQSIDSISYSVTNGNPVDTFAGTYTYPFSAVSPSFVISDIPAGAGYTLSLRCTSGTGSVTCAGNNLATPSTSDASAGFSVKAGAVTMVNVVLTCTMTTDAAAD